MLYWAWLFTNKFFCSGLACLSNKPKTKTQAWLIYKQTNMNELFIKPSPSCSRSAWFVYSPSLNISFIFFTTSLKYFFIIIFYSQSHFFHSHKATAHTHCHQPLIYFIQILMLVEISLLKPTWLCHHPHLPTKHNYTSTYRDEPFFFPPLTKMKA